MSQNLQSSLKIISNLSSVIYIFCVFGTAIYLAHALLGGLSLNFSSDASPQISRGGSAGLWSWRERASLIPYHLSVLFTLLYAGATFREFSKGNIFTERSVKRFRLFSFWMFSLALTGMFSGVFLYVLRIDFSQASENNLTLGFSGDDFITLGISAIICAFALILREAKRHVDDVRLIF